MMKKIAIVYNDSSSLSDDELQAVCHILKENSYSVTLHKAVANSEIATLYQQWMEEPPHLILTIDFAGFQYRTTGRSTAYNQIPTNIIHYLSTLSGHPSSYLCGVFNIATTFLCLRSSDVEQIQAASVYATDVRHITSLPDSLPALLAEMDWRIPN